MAGEEEFGKLAELKGRITATNERRAKWFEEIKEIDALLGTLSGEWNAIFKDFQDKVKKGEVSLGDPVLNHVLARGSYCTENFSRDYDRISLELRRKIAEISERGHFVYDSTRDMRSLRPWGVERSYTIGFFDEDNPFEITTEAMRINLARTAVLSIEMVFVNEGLSWPFISNGDGKKIEVHYSGLDAPWNSVVIPSGVESVAGLEEALAGNPIALLILKKFMKSETNDDLEKSAEEQRHKIALGALKRISGAYGELRRADQRIIEIEKEWNPDIPANYGQYSIRPVIPIEKDPVMAKIASFADREIRNNNLRTLVECFRDLERTGLSAYGKPIEIPGRVGEKTVYCLPEFAGHIARVLEIKFDEQKAARN